MTWTTSRDTELFDLLARERERQNTTLQLIASENFTSPDVMEATGSVLTNKYSEGYPSKRYYGGNQVIDEVEVLARDRACTLFGADHANVQPHAGANANVAVYLALLERRTSRATSRCSRRASPRGSCVCRRARRRPPPIPRPRGFAAPPRIPRATCRAPCAG